MGVFRDAAPNNLLSPRPPKVAMLEWIRVQIRLSCPIVFGISESFGTATDKHSDRHVHEVVFCWSSAMVIRSPSGLTQASK